MSENMSTLTTPTIIRSSTIVLISALAAHGINYAFTILMSRVLIPHEYVVLVTIISLINIVGIPLQTATTVAAKYTSFILRGYKDYLNATLLLGIGIMGAYLSIIPILSATLALPWQALLLISPAIFLMPSLCMNMGIFQGTRQLWVFSGIPAGSSLIKLGSGIALVSAGYASLGALGAISIATILAWLASTIYVVYELRNTKYHTHASSHIPDQWKKSAAIILVSGIAIALLGNMDIIAAKLFFVEQLAAEYSVLAVISRSISYGALIMIPILFPAMSQAGNPQIARALLQKGVSISLIASAAVLILFALYPSEIITLLPGVRYSNVAPYLLAAGVATALWSISQLFLSYFIATDKKKFLIPLLVATGLQILGITLFHDSIAEILMVVTSTQAVLLSIFVWTFIRTKTANEQ